MFDIAKEAVVETGTIHVNNAAGEPLYADAERKKPVQIVVYGPGSKAAAIVQARQNAAVRKNMQENDGTFIPPSIEDREKAFAEDLATLTVSFENFDYSPAGGAKGVELFRAVYSDPKLKFIANQVNKFIGDWGKFKPASSGT